MSFTLVGVGGDGEGGDAGGGGIQDQGDRLGLGILTGQGGDPGTVDVGPCLPGMGAAVLGAVAEAGEHGVGAVDLVAGGGEVLADRAEFGAAGDAVVHEPGGLGTVSVGGGAGVDAQLGLQFLGDRSCFHEAD